MAGMQLGLGLTQEKPSSANWFKHVSGRRKKQNQL